MSPAVAGGARRATANSTPVETSEGVKSVGGYFPAPPVDHYAERIEPRRPSLLAFTNPTVNSYHRLVPGFEAPVNLVYSAAHPVGLHPDPAHGQQPQGQAPGVPLPRLVGQPVPGLLGHHDGRHGRHQEQDRAGAHPMLCPWEWRCSRSPRRPVLGTRIISPLRSALSCPARDDRSASAVRCGGPGAVRHHSAAGSRAPTGHRSASVPHCGWRMPRRPPEPGGATRRRAD